MDWGLGHATRCIPIIYFLIEHGVAVTIASDGKSYELLKKEFPHLPIFLLKGYNIRYSKHRTFWGFKILMQLHKIIRAIFSEHMWLKKMQKKHQWDLLISDNRYGLFTRQTKTIIITHQLHVFSGMGNNTDRILQQVLYGYINRFNNCWIPDAAEEPNLTGLLAHPTIKPKRVTYIGPLSRMTRLDAPLSNKILIILSGPEPQRTLLENILVAQIKTIDQPFLLVRGLPSETAVLDLPKHIESINFLGASDLSTAIASASTVICRSGYSSIMDLVKMGKKAILIPTPGQTEQEYLGQRLMNQKMFVCQHQDQVDIQAALGQLDFHQCQHSSLNFEQFKQALANLGI